MIVKDNCCLVCTELRRSGYDEEGILSAIPHRVLIRTIHNLGLNEEEVVEYLLTCEYLEKKLKMGTSSQEKISLAIREIR